MRLKIFLSPWASSVGFAAALLFAAAGVNAQGPAVAPADRVIALSAADQNRVVTAPVGAVIAVRLPENASTGYQWVVDAADPALFDPPTRESIYPERPPGFVGGGGEAVWRFRVRAAGAGAIQLRYGRAWEQDHTADQRFQVRIEVRP